MLKKSKPTKRKSAKIFTSNKSKTLLGRARFTRVHFVAFTLIFGVLGIATLLFSRAATVALTTVEAEGMTLAGGTSLVSDSTASAGKALYFTTNATATGAFAITQDSTSITARAKGIQCEGTPQLIIKVDGTTVQTSSVSSTDWTDYSANLKLSGGSHTIAVVFANPYASTKGKSGKPKCTRALYIDKVILYGEAPDPVADQPSAQTAWPASFSAGPAGKNNPLPNRDGYPAKQVWVGMTPPQGCPNFPCSYQDHINGFKAREAAIGSPMDFIHDFQQGTCSLDMNRFRDYQAAAPVLVLSWQPNPRAADRVIAGEADACIRAVAQQLSTANKPVILRMYHEWNGYWMAWSKNSDGSRITHDQARQMWVRTVDQLRSGGAFSTGKVAVLWDMHEGHYGNGDVFDETLAYPGDSYVDWVGSTGYNGNNTSWCGYHTGWCQFAEVFTHGNCLPWANMPSGTSCSSTRKPVGMEVDFRGKKPYMATEFGSVEGAAGMKGDWMRHAGAYVKTNMPGMTALSYFDQNARLYGEQSNWLLDTSSSSLQGFVDMARDPYFNP